MVIRKKDFKKNFALAIFITCFLVFSIKAKADLSGNIKILGSEGDYANSSEIRGLFFINTVYTGSLGVNVTGAVCGNGIQEGSEECDGTDFGIYTGTCNNYNSAYSSGNLICTASCTISTTNCVTAGGGGGGDGEDEDEEEEEPIDEDEEVISNITENYFFTVETDKFAYKEKEDIMITVKTYRNITGTLENNTLVDFDSVSFELYKERSNISLGTYALKENSSKIGMYHLLFDNNLESGNIYDLRFTAIGKGIILKKDKQVLITYNPYIPNVIRNPTGDIKRMAKTISTIIFILLIIIFFVWKNRKKIKKEIKKRKR